MVDPSKKSPKKTKASPSTHEESPRGSVSNGPSHAHQQSSVPQVEPLQLPETLFSLVKESRPQVIARAFLAASHSSIEASKQYLSETLKTCFASGSDQLTGLFLFNKQSTAVVIEAESDKLTSLIVKLSKQAGNQSTTHKGWSSVRVCGYTDDVGERIFKGVNETVCNSNTSGATKGVVEEEDVNAVIADIYAKLLAIGKSVKETGKSLEDIKTKHAGWFPTNESVFTLSTHDDVMTAGEFEEVYATPIKLRSFADEVWPMQNIADDLLQ